jgi:hypothetical protein
MAGASSSQLTALPTPRRCSTAPPSSLGGCWQVSGSRCSLTAVPRIVGLHKGRRAVAPGGRVPAPRGGALRPLDQRPRVAPPLRRRRQPRLGGVGRRPLAQRRPCSPRSWRLFRRVLSPRPWPDATPGLAPCSPPSATPAAVRRSSPKSSASVCGACRRARCLRAARRWWRGLGAGAARIYIAACHFVMRLVVVLFAEARELLPIDSPIYHQAYGLRGLLESARARERSRARGRRVAPAARALPPCSTAGSLAPRAAWCKSMAASSSARDPPAKGSSGPLALLESLPRPPTTTCPPHPRPPHPHDRARPHPGAPLRVPRPGGLHRAHERVHRHPLRGPARLRAAPRGTSPSCSLNLGDQPALPLDRSRAWTTRPSPRWWRRPRS